jgi:hypothetical protein
LTNRPSVRSRARLWRGKNRIVATKVRVVSVMGSLYSRSGKMTGEGALGRFPQSALTVGIGDDDVHGPRGVLR